MSIELQDTDHVAELATYRKAGSHLDLVPTPAYSTLNPFQLGWLTQFRRGLATGALLALADVIALGAALIVSAVVSRWAGWHLDFDHSRIGLLFGTVLLLAFVTSGLYPGIGLNSTSELRRVWIAVTLVGTAFASASLLRPFEANPNLVVVIACSGSLFFIPIVRSIARHYGKQFSWWGYPVIILGAGPVGASLYRVLAKHPNWGMRPLGILDDRAPCQQARSVYCGPLSYAREVIPLDELTWVLIAMPDRPSSEVLPAVERHLAEIPNCHLAPGLAWLSGMWSTAESCDGIPGLPLNERLLLPPTVVTKRIIDLVLTVFISIVALPIFLLLAILVKVSSAGPVFYSQERLGLRGRRFRAWKFRTMVANADREMADHLAANPEARQEWERNHKLRDDPRVTAVGKLLRKTSLDELPQIWNVLRGEMSLVGPRPIVEGEIGKYGKCFERYRQVRPGITGLWQVSGRNNTTYDERVALDNFYVQNWSPWLDLCILAATVKVVLLGEGAY